MLKLSRTLGRSSNLKLGGLLSRRPVLMPAVSSGATQSFIPHRGFAKHVDFPNPLIGVNSPAAPTLCMLDAARLSNTANVANTKAVLKLEDGARFEGVSFGADTCVSGEAVFTTSLVGYPESMTDPSYCGQILVFTQPLVGNYGVPAPTVDEYGLLKHFESDRIHVKGIVVSDYATHYSHWNAVSSLGDWCKSQGIPAISGVDTRAIVQNLRRKGSSPASLTVGDDAKEQPFVDPNTQNLVAQVSVKSPVVYNRGANLRVALIDCGAKHNIIRSLADGGVEVVVLPWDYDYTQELSRFDGIFLSNGPGDPRKCAKSVSHLRYALEHFHKPIFGICMGNLLMGMAAGLGVKKLRYGNRGHNQPALNLVTGQCVITSQNHGYALDDDVMPSNWAKYFINANDGSNEGIRHLYKPISSVQFHPEARGGPRDCENLFNDFLADVRSHKLDLGPLAKNRLAQQPATI